MASDYVHNSVAAIRESISDPVSCPVPVLLAATAGTLGAWLIWTKWRNRNRKLPPSPRGWPILGNLLDVSSNDTHLDLIHLQQEYKLPDVFTLNLGPRNKMIILNSYDVIKDALVSHGDLFAGRPPSVGVDVMNLHDDIFTRTYSLDYKTKKMFVISALRGVGMGNTKSTEEKILGQFDSMANELEVLLKNNETVDLSGVLDKVAYNVIFEILFNKRYNHDDPELIRRIQLTRDWWKHFLEAWSLELLSGCVPTWILRSVLKTMLSRTPGYRKFIREEVAEHQRKLDPESLKDFIDIYLTKKKGFIDLESLTNTMLFFLPDASDTIGGFINWIILYVTAHPAIMKRMKDEIVTVTGGNRHVTLSDRPQLSFTEAVIMEVNRVACPVATTAVHCAIKDSYFRGYFIPKHVSIICNLYSAMRDPKYFENPDDFNPDRFLDKDGSLIRCDAWIPFGMGSRKCVGEQLVKAELFLFTANLLQKYDFSFPEENQDPTFKPHTGHVIRGPQPYKVTLKPRI